MIKNKNLPAFLLQIFLITWISLLSGSVWAAKLYVLENLRLRTEPSLESSILATVKKGEEVEVLGIDGDFTHVESPAGTKGWVASSFLTTEKPPEPEPKPVPTKNSKLAQAKVTINKQKNELKKLKNKLSQQEKEFKQLQKQMQDMQTAQPQATPEVAPTVSVSDEKIAKIREILGPDPQLPGGKKNKTIGFSELSGIHYSLAAGLLLFGFIFGLFWGDFIQRRRHGGYRV